MKRRMVFLVASLVLTGCVIHDAEEMTVEEGAKEECRMITESGTILPKRICYNKATWAAIDERDKEAADKTMDDIRSRRGYTPPVTSTGP